MAFRQICEAQDPARGLIEASSSPPTPICALPSQAEEVRGGLPGEDQAQGGGDAGTAQENIGTMEGDTGSADAVRGGNVAAFVAGSSLEEMDMGDGCVGDAKAGEEFAGGEEVTSVGGDGGREGTRAAAGNNLRGLCVVFC